MTTAPVSRDTLTARRTRVRHLADQGLSLREIAAELGVSKDTVARDLAVARQADAADRTPDATPDSGSATDETRLNMAVTPRMTDDFAVLADAGLPREVAVAYAVELLANTYRHAWMKGLTPRRVRPTITRIVVQPEGEHHA
ncbi:helix-turn-helix domain-containing protein [Streptomyces sp. NPDC048188]|uniref:helix-turn-helix domain-containing protein n=1 Tax=Streptomyces sp. NPDC048188 TaxID=3155749 RepID=UPI0034408973